VQPISVLFVGQAERREFVETRDVLTQAANLGVAPNPEAAEALLACESFAPEVIVLAEAYPGQFAPAAVDRLRTAAPLARIVALLGSWCEGETRSGRPTPGAIRLYWHQARPRVAQELQHVAAGQVSSWSLPATATEEERLLATADIPLSTNRGLVAVHALRTTMADWLSAACQRGGYASVRLAGPRWPDVAGVTAGIFDATDLGPMESTQLTRMASHFPGVPIVALLDFPRVEDRDRALACGAAAVLSKPLILADLLWLLRNR
jgi:CheY-like chemotaxis protein